MKITFSKYLLLLISISLISCNDKDIIEIQAMDSAHTSTQESSIIIKESSTFDDSIHVEFEIERIDDEFANLIIKMDLFGNTWIVSPLEENYPYGQMTINFNNNRFIAMSSITENPASESKSNPTWENQYKVISGKTILNQKIKLLNDEEFDLSGHIFFVLEPICTATELNFEISNKDGVLTVKQIK
jgi:hypothetical protein